MRTFTGVKHYSYINDYAYRATCHAVSESGIVTYRAMCALANQDLALETDRDEEIESLRRQPASAPIFNALHAAGACVQGLRRVGRHAVSWGHLGELIRELDLEDVQDGEDYHPCQPHDVFGYLEWCEENLDELTYELVWKGFDNV